MNGRSPEEEKKKQKEREAKNKPGEK